MRKFFKYFFLFFLSLGILMAAGFFIPRSGEDKTSCQQDSISIVIGSNGYHTSFILPVANSVYNWNKDFHLANDIQYIEFGWGNKRFYMSRDFSIKATLRALFPSETVMHVVFLDATPEEWFKGSETKRIHLCKKDYLTLVNFIKGYFALDAHGEKIYLGEGLYGPSAFYKSSGSYHALETCNTWVAEGLRTIEIETPLWGGTAPSIMWHIRNYE